MDEVTNAICVIALTITKSFSLTATSPGRINISNHNAAADCTRATVSWGASARVPIYSRSQPAYVKQADKRKKRTSSFCHLLLHILLKLVVYPGLKCPEVHLLIQIGKPTPQHVGFEIFLLVQMHGRTPGHTYAVAHTYAHTQTHTEPMRIYISSKARTFTFCLLRMRHVVMMDSMQGCARVYTQVSVCVHRHVHTRALYPCTRERAHVTRCARTCVFSGYLQRHQKCTHALAHNHTLKSIDGSVSRRFSPLRNSMKSTKQVESSSMK